MRRIALLGLVALITLSWLAPTGVTAQIDLPITPDPADCEAEPVDIDRLVEEAAATLSADVEERETPTGEATTASDEVADELLGTVIASVACTNANQPLRALSYFTEDYLLHRISDEPTVTLGHLQAAATRAPEVAPVEDRVTIAELIHAGVYPGGANLILRWANADGDSWSGLRLVEDGGSWKIDGAIEASEPLPADAL